MPPNCTCGLAMRMNSAIAAEALAELRKYDSEAADRILEAANKKVHQDWCESATKWLQQRKRKRGIKNGRQSTRALP